MTDAYFQQTVWNYYSQHSRSMPWRDNTSPYYVLVSEMMLQQTQVDRVIPKFLEFIQQFPDVHALANASFGEVLRTWSGLGYNRRARYLHTSAQRICSEHKAIIPDTIEALIGLPGIGNGTARAILAYAYNKPVVFIETNIRAVYIHHFFKNQKDIADSQLLPIVGRTLYTNNPREWYWALMDYGTYIKKTFANPANASKHHVKQSSFEGSTRQLRGQILKLLLERPYTKQELQKIINDERILLILSELVGESMIENHNGTYQIQK